MSLSALSSNNASNESNGLAAGDFDLLRKLLVDKAGIVLEASQEYLAEADYTCGLYGMFQVTC